MKNAHSAVVSDIGKSMVVTGLRNTPVCQSPTTGECTLEQSVFLGVKWEELFFSLLQISEKGRAFPNSIASLTARLEEFNAAEKR